ncbi:ribosomal large subunit pseudouridine synthase C [Deltaproteobacteria bacterium]|nr:ribosomal large subunit pseudouridine synthase C [Deltaproteobacteria bacterium]
MVPILTVDAAEAGMKLIRFLARRLLVCPAAGDLHRWIRTGQVRVNQKRAGAFDRLNAFDSVRLPPFALPKEEPQNRTDSECPPLAAGDYLGGQIRVLASAGDFLALEKTAGLPTQPGTGHSASVVSRLREHFAKAVYIPAPAHRLDKNASGILLAGKTHAAQEELHALFRSGGRNIEKIYLAWVEGAYPPDDAEMLLCDYLAKGETRTAAGCVIETMKIAGAREGKAARCRVSCLERRPLPCGKCASLLRIVLETGLTHQIRIQLASRSFPIIGDTKYAGKPYPHMLLHAHSLRFPWHGETFHLVSPPRWPEPFSLM